MDEYFSGVLISGSNLIYTCPVGLIKLLTFRFNNPLAYTLQVIKYDASNGVSTPLYDLTLDAGDVVVDDGLYKLNENDTITVVSVPAGTTYILQVIDTPL